MIYLLSLLILLQFGDWYTTQKALKLGAKEANPVMKYMIKIFGVNVSLAIKTVLLIAIIYQLYLLNSWISLLILATFYSWVLWNNITVIKVLK